MTASMLPLAPCPSQVLQVPEEEGLQEAPQEAAEEEREQEGEEGGLE